VDRKEAEFGLQPLERSGKQVVVMDGVRKQYEQRTVLGGVSGELLYGEKVMLIGDNGSGKSTLLKLILGEVSPDSGSVRLGSRVEAGYLAQQAPIHPGQSVLDYFRTEAAMEEGEARGRLAAYLFYGAEVFKSVGQLSGGEWTRLRLALLVHRKPNLLILDEPTNHMDIASREALEEALEDYPGTILIVTHDRYLINRLAQKIWELDRGTLGVYLGGFDEYKEESARRKARNMATVEESRRTRPEPKAKDSAGKEKKKDSQPDIGKLEAEMKAIEVQLGELDVLLYTQNHTSTPAQLERHWQERETLQEQLNRLMEVWIEAGEE
jgi:ATPase subunit of ABC transporter with duplicated ATPase domains